MSKEKIKLKEFPGTFWVANTLEIFENETHSEFLCHKICKRQFKSLKEHTEFINNGGCARIIDVLSKS